MGFSFALDSADLAHYISDCVGKPHTGFYTVYSNNNLMVDKERPVERSEREESPIGEKTSISDLHLLSRTQQNEKEFRENSNL